MLMNLISSYFNEIVCIFLTTVNILIIVEILCIFAILKAITE